MGKRGPTATGGRRQHHLWRLIADGETRANRNQTVHLTFDGQLIADGETRANRNLMPGMCRLLFLIADGETRANRNTLVAATTGGSL